MNRCIEVVCAVIRSGEHYLAVQRSETMSDPLLWEFPGGKVEVGESHAAAIQRELAEELSMRVSIWGYLRPSQWVKPDRTILLYPILCVPLTRDLQLHEHREARWLSVDELKELKWCAADLPIIQILQMPEWEGARWWNHS